MPAPGVQELIDSVFTVHRVRLTEAQAAAMLAERASYAALVQDLSGLLCFEDEPGNFVHAMAGRRHWRGAAR